MRRPISFRNVARYVRDVDASVPLYEALGFRVVRRLSDLVVLENDEGFRVVLHVIVPGLPAELNETAIGFTVEGPIEEARAYLETAGFRLLRAPAHGDVGFFFIYGDRDGNPVNLVAMPALRKTARTEDVTA